MFYNDYDKPITSPSISLEKYRKICKACDEILLDSKANEVTTAIPFLHVIREHPIFLKQYEELFNIRKKNTSNLNIVLKTKSLFIYSSDLLVKTFSKNKYWNTSHPINDNYDYIIISHFLNISHAGKIKDFYFDELPAFLHKKGVRVLVVLINHTTFSSRFIAKKWDLKNETPRVILTKNLGLVNELKCFVKFIRESKRLKKRSKEEKDKIKKQIFQIASRQFVPTINNLKLSKQFYKLFEKTNTKRVITTHEGHAWERLLFANSRKVNPNTICIGYQHALIFKEQYAIKRNLQKIYNPNLILASGIIGKNNLESSNNLKGVDFYLFGSNRFFEVKKEFVESVPNKTILVIPEAIYSECVLLFEYSIKCATLMPETTFIWRLHPLMNFEQIKFSNIDFQNLPINIVLSNSSIELDISKSQFVLYRGSTAVVTSALHGLRPIYLNVDGEMTIDPLFSINYYKFNVNTPNQLLSLLNKESQLIGQESIEKSKFISEVKKLFHPLDFNFFLNQ